jgi:flagellar hook-length control protein FliK
MASASVGPALVFGSSSHAVQAKPAAEQHADAFAALIPTADSDADSHPGSATTDLPPQRMQTVAAARTAPVTSTPSSSARAAGQPTGPSSIQSVVHTRRAAGVKSIASGKPAGPPTDTASVPPPDRSSAPSSGTASASDGATASFPAGHTAPTVPGDPAALSSETAASPAAVGPSGSPETAAVGTASVSRGTPPATTTQPVNLLTDTAAGGVAGGLINTAADRAADTASPSTDTVLSPAPPQSAGVSQQPAGRSIGPASTLPPASPVATAVGSSTSRASGPAAPSADVAASPPAAASTGPATKFAASEVPGPAGPATNTTASQATAPTGSSSTAAASTAAAANTGLPGAAMSGVGANASVSMASISASAATASTTNSLQQQPAGTQPQIALATAPNGGPQTAGPSSPPSAPSGSAQAPAPPSTSVSAGGQPEQAQLPSALAASAAAVASADALGAPTLSAAGMAAILPTVGATAVATSPVGQRFAGQDGGGSQAASPDALGHDGDTFASISGAPLSEAPAQSLPQPVASADGLAALPSALGPLGQGSDNAPGGPRPAAAATRADAASGPDPGSVAAASLPAPSVSPAATGNASPALAPAPQALADQTHALLAMRVNRAIQDGQSTVSLELHPAELGRVEVHLSFRSDGVGVQMTIDRRETYDAFTRDRASLEQQFNQAGIDLGSGGLDLRYGQQSDQSATRQAPMGNRSTAMPQPVAAVRPASARAGNSLIDILA